MNSIHAPQRLEDESREQYKARRVASKLAGQRITGKGLSGGVASREQYRNDMRKSGAMGLRTRAYVALMAAWASKRIVNWNGARDEHGAYTITGSGGRKWLGGISAQRGY
jgi:hypothetical protein